MNRRRDTKRPAVFWVGLALGWLVIGIGVRFAVMEVGEAFGALLVALGGFAIIHDGVVLPAAAVLSVATERMVPPAARLPVRFGLAASWVLALISIPAMGRFGAIADNPSVLPVNVGRNLAILIGLIWVGVGVAAAYRLRADRTGSARA